MIYFMQNCLYAGFIAVNKNINIKNQENKEK